MLNQNNSRNTAQIIYFSYFRLQLIVFSLVAASFTNIYVTQPVLPVLQHEFSADMVLVSFSVSAVILGIAISNLLIGFQLFAISVDCAAIRFFN